MILDPTDQRIRDQGFNFVPFDRYLAAPFQIPTIDPNTGSGITSVFRPRSVLNQGNQMSFTNQGVTGLVDDFTKTTRDKYFDRQDTPLVDDLYQSKLDRTFMGFPSFREQELTGPDLGAYIGSGTDVPLEPTMAGSIQSKIGNVTGGIQDLMSKVPSITGLLSRMGIQNFNSLSPLDQEFIKQSSGYTGPTIFGENTMGTSKDPFGRNVESLFGNYAEKVRDDFSNLSEALSPTGKIGSKEAYQGATFNEATGMFEPDDDDDEASIKAAAYANQMNKMNLAKFAFDQKQLEKQKENERVDQANKQRAANAMQAQNRAGRTGGYQAAESSPGAGDGYDSGFMEGPKGGGQDLSSTMGSFMDGGIVDLVDIYD